MITLLKRIDCLYKSSDAFLEGLLLKEDENEKLIIQAILLLKNVDIDYGIVRKTVLDVKEKEAKELIESACNANCPDGLLLKIYLLDGYAINIRPDFENVKGLYEKLYERTGEEEVKKSVLDDFYSHVKKRKASYGDEAREMRYRRLLSSSPKTDLDLEDDAFRKKDKKNK